MARIKLTTHDQQDWVLSSDQPMDEDQRARLGPGELASEFRVREAGGGDKPQLVELRYPPGTEIRVHSHDEDEILYVAEGSMVIGNRTLGTGTCLSIAGGTFYGFNAGKDGLRLLNFRPRVDRSFNLPADRDAAAQLG